MDLNGFEAIWLRTTDAAKVVSLLIIRVFDHCSKMTSPLRLKYDNDGRTFHMEVYVCCHLRRSSWPREQLGVGLVYSDRLYYRDLGLHSPGIASLIMC